MVKGLEDCWICLFAFLLVLRCGLALRRVGILTRTVDASLLHPRLGLCFKMYGPRSVHDHLQSGCVRAESTDNKPPSKNHDVASYQQHLFKS